jgi:serine/threonine protein kinase
MALDTSKPEMQSIGNYDLIAKLAEGGMGWVYKGKNKQTGEIVAIKIVPAHMARNETLLRRFEQEWVAASKLDHQNIVRAIDYCGTGSTPFLVMEFVDGESIGQKLDREGKLAEAEAIRLIAMVCQGLHRAHKQGMIHRDIKPDNIMVTKDGIAKVTDLGLVKEVDAELNLTKTGRGLGTPHFMAPEQFRNAKNADVRCDVYSIGATLYMMVTGELPFGKTSGPLDAWMKKVNNDIAPPRSLVPDLSERCDWAIRRAMSPDPNLRPTSCREFVEDLTGHSTRKIMTPTEQQSGAISQQDLWYLVYKDEAGQMHTVKGSTDGIRRSLKERLLGDATNVRACRSKSGPFEPLKTYPEFRDLVLTPGTPPPGGSGITPVGMVAPPTPPGSSGSSSWNAGQPVGPGSTPGNTSGVMPHIRLKAADDSLSWPALIFLLVVALATAAAVLWFGLIKK